MATEHTVNSSLLFLTLIVQELPTLSQIRQVSPKNQGVSVVWEKSSGNTPKLENYEWSSFILKFSKPFQINKLIERYPYSIKQVRESTAAEMDAAAAQRAAQERAKANNSRVISIDSKNYNRNAPNGVNPSNAYSGIGPAKKHGDRWRVNFTDPGPPLEFKRAEATSANKAVKAAESSINSRRKKTMDELSVL